ncbi:MAG: Sec-independent protein translocase subunit TatA [Pseudonocardiaceae bacterium]|nr:Sec-independent protein translocase subunit TatA [Pseudonocardiaceae bacterium]
MPGIPGGWELVLLLGVLVLLFGATKLPNAARSIGQSMRIFKAETKGLRSDDSQGDEPADTTAQREQTQALPPSSPQPDPPRPAEQPQPRTDTTR